MEQKINKIRIESRGAITLFDIKGDITFFSEPFVNKAYEDANKQGITAILLIFEEGAYINSGGIAVLIQLLSKTKKNNQKAGITGLSDHFKKIFNMVGISRISKIYNSIEESLEEMTKYRPR